MRGQISRYPDEERKRWVRERKSFKSTALIANESKYNVTADTIRRYTNQHGTYPKPLYYATNDKKAFKLQTIHPVFGFPF